MRGSNKPLQPGRASDFGECICHSCLILSLPDLHPLFLSLAATNPFSLLQCTAVPPPGKGSPPHAPLPQPLPSLPPPFIRQPSSLLSLFSRSPISCQPLSLTHLPTPSQSRCGRIRQSGTFLTASLSGCMAVVGCPLPPHPPAAAEGSFSVASLAAAAADQPPAGNLRVRGNRQEGAWARCGFRGSSSGSGRGGRGTARGGGGSEREYGEEEGEGGGELGGRGAGGSGAL